MSDVWEHDALAEDLAAHLRGASYQNRRMVWLNVPMGRGGAQRPDVFAMFKSFTKPLPMVYEVKVSRADLASDLTSGKWMGYQGYACGVFFAVPEGLAKKTDVPAACGLMVRVGEGWKYLKKPTLQTAAPGFEQMMRLLLRATEEKFEWSHAQAIGAWKHEKAVRERVGKEVAEYIVDRESALAQLESLEMEKERAYRRAEEIRRKAEEDGRREVEWREERLNRAVRDAAILLGLPADSGLDLVAKLLREAAEAGGGMSRALRRGLEEALAVSTRLQEKLEVVLAVRDSDEDQETARSAGGGRAA